MKNMHICTYMYIRYFFVTILNMHVHVYTYVDKDIKECMETLAQQLEVIDDRLETLGDIVEQQQIAGQCSNAMTGSFHNPAHNCSHIALLNPNATSGRGYHCQCFNLCPIAILFSP